MILSCGASVMCEDYPRCSDDPSAEEIRDVVFKIKTYTESGQDIKHSEDLKALPQQGLNFLINVAKGYKEEKTYRETLDEKVKTLVKKYEHVFPKEKRKIFEKFVKNEVGYSAENMEITERVFSTFGLRDSEILIWSLKGAFVDGK